MVKKAAVVLIGTFFIALLIYYFLPESKLPAGVAVDKLVVLKSKRRLLAYSGGVLVKTYKISIGFTPKGKKTYDGDGKTPEGFYYINNKNPNSVCHKNLGISYPNQSDKLSAKKAGKTAGGDIKIHGIKNGRGYIGKFQRWCDWTDGCIALTDGEIDDLYKHTAVGTPIELRI